MTFNKWLPDRAPEPQDQRTPQEVAKARMLRFFWLASSLMLVTGYVLMALALTGRL